MACRSICSKKQRFISGSIVPKKALRPKLNYRRLDGRRASKESMQVLYAPLLHHLVESAHGILLEVLGAAMSVLGRGVPVLLIDEHGVRVAFYLVGDVADASRLPAGGRSQQAQSFGYLVAIFGGKFKPNDETDHREIVP
jgi:hypothetical protein